MSSLFFGFLTRKCAEMSGRMTGYLSEVQKEVATRQQYLGTVAEKSPAIDRSADHPQPVLVLDEVVGDGPLDSIQSLAYKLGGGTGCFIPI